MLLYFDCIHSREERRWLEKQNKAARQKRKKEEVSRMRTLVGIYMHMLCCVAMITKFWSLQTMHMGVTQE